MTTDTVGSDDQGFAFTEMTEEMESAFLTYAQYVIQDRSIPDVRDGLKPVQRRVLWAMHQLGCRPDTAHKKSALIGGETHGKYHPHGQPAIYGAMVRMAQDFSMSVPLVDGQGNFGSVDGLPPSAERYTEARLSRFGYHVLFSDINDETIDMVPNYSEEYMEPSVLPARLPLLLLTGASGIAVGMATHIPPFNLGEVCDAFSLLLQNPDVTAEELVDVLPGPDFPLGGIVECQNVVEVVESGRGVFRYRSTATFEAEGNKRDIIMTSVPYGGNKSALLEQIAELRKEDKIDGIQDAHDESASGDVRVVIRLKSGVSGEAVLNSLYKHSGFQTSYSSNIVTIAGQRPELLGVRGVLERFAVFRREVVRRRTECRLRKAEGRLRRVLVLLKAIAKANQVVKIVRKSQEPVSELMTLLNANEEEAKWVYEMPLRTLSRKDTARLTGERDELQVFVAECNDILANPERVTQIMLDETAEIKEKFAVSRRTTVVNDFGRISVDDTVKRQDVALVFLSDGSVKSTALDEYRLLRRKAKGMKGVVVPDGIHPVLVSVVCSHEHVMIVTDAGNRYRLRVFDIPAVGRTRRPCSLVDCVPGFLKDEQIVSLVPSVLEDSQCLVLVASDGKLKKQSAATVQSARDTTTLIYPVENAELVGALVASVDDQLVLCSSDGKVLRTSLESIREVQSRTASGVKAMKLRKGAKLVSVSVVDLTGYLLTVTKNGFAKRTPVSEYRLQARAGQGVIGCGVRDGDELVFACCVPSADQSVVFVMTNQNKVVRVRTGEVREVAGRNGLGVALKNMAKGEYVVAVCLE